MANSDDQPERLIGPATMATLVLLGGVLLGALWLRSGLIGADRWPINWLDVEGELQRTSASQIRAAAAGPASRGFFSADLERVRESVQALPWVAVAEVSRHWPDALRIHIREHQPVARWNESSLFSDRGEVFTVTGSQNMQGLARLSGPENRRQDVLQEWLWMRRELGRIGMDIRQMHLDERGAWTVRLGTGLELLLGREQVRERLSRFISVHDDLAEPERRPERVDLRYTNGLAVRWAEHAETLEDEQHG
ncbi:cell division protein FtsQ/DivIB [Wenzhouxiangella marina]|uniref:cell division protein FtsQ/DivIB n=1 Tax=Wenzhouxiangella marina TaxID=1579979 RepID=UPI000673657F|nr:cell division protein FtsQ/DivIB [Wenzhouxiangella marina]MBB6088586.1 cell division protein FtsQ [Wenzhouxiangella marina]